MKTNKILIKKCKRCGKEITSIYQKQLDYNYKAHLLSCKIKGEPGPDKDQGKASNIIKNQKEEKAKCHKTQMKME